MPDGSKVDENHVAMGLLQRQGGVHGGGRASRAPLGPEEGKHPSLPDTANVASAGRTEAGQSFEQGFGASRVVDVFPGSSTHAGDDARWPGHLAIRENGNLLRGGANQFDGMNGPLSVMRGNVDDHYFGAGILKQTQDGVGRSSRKPDVAEYGLSQARRFQTILQCG